VIFAEIYWKITIDWKMVCIVNLGVRCHLVLKFNFGWLRELVYDAQISDNWKKKCSIQCKTYVLF